MFAVSIPNAADLLGVGGNGDEVVRHSPFVSAQPLDQPRPCAVGVGQRFQRRKRLRRDDEQRLLGIEVAGRLDHVGAVDVGDEPHRHAPVAVGAERLVGHHRAEVGAADANVDNVADALARVAGVAAVANGIAERRHAVEHLVHLGHHVDSVDHQRAPTGHPQGDVQYGAVLGRVDVVAAEHRLCPLGQPACLRQLRQQRDRLVGDPVLRVVHVEAGGLERHPRAPAGIGGEQLAQVAAADLAMVGIERLPGGLAAKRHERCWRHRRGAPLRRPPATPVRGPGGLRSARRSRPRRGGRRSTGRRRNGPAAGTPWSRGRPTAP